MIPNWLQFLSGCRWLRILLCAPFCVCLCVSHVHADLYKFIDDAGVIHFANYRKAPEYRLIRQSRWSSPSNGALNPGNRQRFAELIAETARRHEVEPELIHAVIRAESAYNPDAVSKAGAVGLMQLMPTTATRYGVSDRRDPLQNVSGGVRYLKDLLAQFAELELALAAYNAGENAVLKYGNQIPPFPETQNYVRKVLAYYRDGRAAF